MTEQELAALAKLTPTQRRIIAKYLKEQNETYLALLAERDALKEQNAEALAALKLAELWLVNCLPITEIEGPKPLPVMRAAMRSLGHD